MTRNLAIGLSALLSVTLLGCSRSQAPAEGAQGAANAASAANVTDERLLKADSEPSQWMTYGGTYSEQRFSQLKEINKDNVKQLGLVWAADYDTNLNQTGTPLYIDGVIYVSTAWSKVYAFDAKSGKQLWQYNPKTPGEWIRNVCCGIVNRGIAAYKGKIYIGTLDGRLVALDAKTGTPAWEKLTVDQSQHYSITSAPRIVKGMVLIGNSGGEYGVRGYVGAYDAETGDQKWRFYTVPDDPSKPQSAEYLTKAVSTWGNKEEWWKLGGGGTVWDAIVYDPKTDLVYFGTGNGTPWNQAKRDSSAGDNLYLASIIAVKPDTGEYVWHYQTTPADTWDYDAVSPMMTVDLKIDGQERHVILQACKNGFFYVLDAKSGELLKADAFVEMNWAKGVDLKTGRPNQVKEARFPEGKGGWNLEPGVQGAHGWQANAYSPETGLIYIPTQVAYFPMISDPAYKPSAVGYNLGLDFGAPMTYYQKNPGQKSGFESHLAAWDPVTAKVVWKGESNQGATGGAVATAGGLVFHAGGTSNEFRAYDAKTGEKLWTFNTQTGLVAGPITFELGGKQYVAASVGGNVPGGYYAPNYSRMLVFALGGTATLPAVKEYVPRPLDPPKEKQAADVVKTGGESYSKYCAACHGENGQTRGANFPDLSRTPLLHSQEGFDAVVRGGALKAKGMASFADSLQPADTAALRSYLIDRAQFAKANPPPGAPPEANRTGNQHDQK